MQMIEENLFETLDAGGWKLFCIVVRNVAVARPVILCKSFYKISLVSFVISESKLYPRVMAAVADPVREKALQDYRKKLLEHKEVESRLKESEKRFVDQVIAHISPLTLLLQFVRR